jgi:integrase
VLWRAGLRIQEALALSEADLDRGRGVLLIRRGKGGRRREVGMDEWAWRAAAAVDRRPARAFGRPAVLCDQRPDTWAAMVGRGRARRPAPAAPTSTRSPATHGALRLEVDFIDVVVAADGRRR